MRIPLPPVGHSLVEIRDISWDEDGRSKAVAVECRDFAGQPLYMIYRLEPAWMFEQPDGPVHSRYTNLLGFYPWPEPSTADIRAVSPLRDTQPTSATIDLDGQTYPSRRYTNPTVIVDIAFTDTASIAIGRPPHRPALPPLTTDDYSSTRATHSSDGNSEYHAYLDLSQGNVFPTSSEVDER